MRLQHGADESKGRRNPHALFESYRFQLSLRKFERLVAHSMRVPQQSRELLRKYLDDEKQHIRHMYAHAKGKGASP